jgi:hypothetical protein
MRSHFLAHADALQLETLAVESSGDTTLVFAGPPRRKEIGAEIRF